MAKIWHLKSSKPNKKSHGWLLNLLAKNRGLTTKKQLADFLNPSLEQILQLKLTQTQKAVDRISQAIKNKEKIIVYSDYDADGICATAIMWETLRDLGASVLPYVPHRVKEGYGLSKDAIAHHATSGVSLIITVDHGVTAVEQVKAAKKLGIDVIISDHHVLPQKPPEAFALVHTTQLCGAGVSWRLCWEIVSSLKPLYKEELLQKLELAALATIADLVPLTSANRAIVKLGLEKLAATKRQGLIALIQSAGVNSSIGTYEIGHILAPRINAMGRIEHGLDSLRLLCTKSQNQARELANLLAKTNSRRQNLTVEAVETARTLVDQEALIGVIAHHSWHEGVIGLVASRLVETYYRPMVVIAKGQTLSKGSARSIPGFNIVEAIRASSEFLVDGGGHPMAAGFTIETKHIGVFKENITKYAGKYINDHLLQKQIEIECELETSDITKENLQIINRFEPYGIGNPQPLFLTKGMMVEDVRGVGAQSQHLKLQLSGFSTIAFNMGDLRSQIRPGYSVDLVYSLAPDHYNGAGLLQLKIKDIIINP